MQFEISTNRFSSLKVMFYGNTGKLNINKGYHFIRRYQEIRGLCFRLSFFGTKSLMNGQYIIQCCFQMHFYPPVYHEFQENTESTNPFGWNAISSYFSIFSSSVWQLSTGFVTIEDLAIRKICLDPDRLYSIVYWLILILLIKMFSTYCQHCVVQIAANR